MLKGQLQLREKTVSRDHTNVCLMQFGATIHVEGTKVSVTGGNPLQGTDVMFRVTFHLLHFSWLQLAMIKGSSITFKNVGLNPTRTGILDVLKDMGA